MNALSNPEGELRILGLMWDRTSSRHLLGQVEPEMFHDPRNRALWDAVARIASRGEPVEASLIIEELEADGHTLEEVGGFDFLASLMDFGLGVRDTRPHVESLRRHYTARELHEFCKGTAGYIAAGKAGRDGGKAIAEHLADRAMGLFNRVGTKKALTRRELLDKLSADASTDPNALNGARYYLPGLDAEIGPLAPGEVLGISAYSGGGKTNLVANIANGFMRGEDKTPCIVFGTEMGERWTARQAAIESMTSQWCAEKKSWIRRDERGNWVPWEAGLERYRAALRRMAPWPLEPVTSPNVTVQEILTRARILRRKYAGQHVVVIVDHLHRLDYGGSDPNSMVGQATRLFKNAAVEDEDGLSFILLYQPRKPSGIELPDTPVSYHQIRGDGLVGNELDVHISPYRYWVETDDWFKTDWGTPKAKVNVNTGLPVLAEPPEKGDLRPKGKKLSDEHVFIANDKRRIDGRGPNHILGFHGPSGRITTGDPMLEHERQLEL